MRVIRESFDNVRTGVDEIAMDLRDDLRMIQHRLGDERTGLHIAAPFEFEQVAFGANDGAVSQPLEQALAPASRANGLCRARAHTHGQ